MLQIYIYRQSIAIEPNIHATIKESRKVNRHSYDLYLIIFNNLIPSIFICFLTYPCNYTCFSLFYFEFILSYFRVDNLSEYISLSVNILRFLSMKNLLSDNLFFYKFILKDKFLLHILFYYMIHWML